MAPHFSSDFPVSSNANPPVLPKALLLDALRVSTQSTAASLFHSVLRTSCRILGAVDAWVTCHAGGHSRAIMQLDPLTVIDFTLDRVFANSIKTLRPVMVLPWLGDSVLCMNLSAGYEGDGPWYMLTIFFKGKIKVTKGIEDTVETLRSSLQMLIIRQISRKRLEMVENGTRIHPLPCESCRQMQSSDEDWMYCDFRFLTSMRPATHSLCEQCAYEVYRAIIQLRANSI